MSNAFQSHIAQRKQLGVAFVFVYCSRFHNCKVTGMLPSVVFWYSPPWLVFLSPSISIIPSRQSKTAAKTCSPCTSNCTHHTDSRAAPPAVADARIPRFACLCLNAVHLFHSRLSLWSPSTVLFIPVSSPLGGHLSPATPIL